MSIRHNFAASGSSPWTEWRGGAGVLLASGDPGGGTLTLEVDNMGDTLAVPNWSLTAAGGFSFVLPRADIRVTLSGATTPDLNVTVR